MKMKRLIKTPALLFLLAMLMVFSPLSVLASETEVSPPQTEVEVTQSETDSTIPTTESTSSEEISPSTPEGVSDVDPGAEPVETDASEEVAEEPPVTKVLSEVTALSTESTFHLDVAIEELSSGLGVHPSFEVVLGDANLQLISKSTASKTNFNDKKGVYELVFPLNTPMKEGDTYYVLLSSASPEVKSLYYHSQTVTSLTSERDEISWQSWEAKVNQRIPLVITNHQFYSEEGEPTEQGLLGSGIYPVRMSLNLQTDITAFYLKDTDGNPVKNQVITLWSDGKSATATSDSRGIATIKTKSLPNTRLTVVTEGRLASHQNPEEEIKTVGHHKISISSLNNAFGFQSVYLEYHPASVKAAGEAKQTDDSTATVSVTVTPDSGSGGGKELSTNWQSSSLDFTSEDGQTFTFSLQSGENSFHLPVGVYSVSSTSDNANVKLSSESLTLAAGKTTTLGVTLTPKYTLTVDKDGREYSFKFLNVESLAGQEFKGTASQIFPVAVGEVYVVEDTATGAIHTVVITSDVTTTKLVLGAGVVYGGTVTTPHTGDDIFYLFGLLVICLILAGGTYVLHMTKQKKLTLGKQTLSLLLIAALVGSVLPISNNNIVLANDGTTIGGSNGEHQSGKTDAPAESVKTHNSLSIIQVGFLPSRSEDNQKLLYEQYSKEWDVLAEHYTSETNNPYIFTEEVQSGMLYFGTTPESRDFLRSSRVSLYSFDFGNGRAILEYGSDYNLGLAGGMAPRNGGRENFQKRVLDNNSSSPLVGFLNEIIRRQGGFSNSTKIWVGVGSSSNSTFGTTAQEVFHDNMMDYLQVNSETRREYDAIRQEILAVEEYINSSQALRDELARRIIQHGDILSLATYFQILYEIANADGYRSYLVSYESTENIVLQSRLLEYAKDSVEFQKAIFEDYIATLKGTGLQRQMDRAQYLEDQYNNPQNTGVSSYGFALFLQAVPAFYKARDQATALFPFNEAVEWYVDGMRKNGGANASWTPRYRNSSGTMVNYSDPSRSWLWRETNPYRQAEILWGGGRGLNESASVNRTHPTFSLISIARETFGGAIRLNTENFPSFDDPYENIFPVGGRRANPTTGWGFLQWYPNISFDRNPKYFTEIYYDLYDDDGNIISTVGGELPNLSNRELLPNSPDTRGILTGSVETQYIAEDGTYALVLSESRPATIKVYDKHTGDGSGRPDDLTTRFAPTSSPYWGVVPIEDSYFSFMFDTNIPSADTLYTYLGGNDSVESNGIPNKYHNAFRTDDTGRAVNFSDALIQIRIPIDAMTCISGDCYTGDPNSTSASYEVPEWRLSKFFTGESTPVNSSLAIIAPNVSGYGGHYTNFTGYHSLAQPRLESNSWLQAQPRIVGGNPSLIRNIGSSYQQFPLYGDYLAIRNSSSVDNIRLASWQGIGNIHDSRITSTAQGSPGSNTRLTQSQKVTMEALPNYSAPRWIYFTWVPGSCGEFGCSSGYELRHFAWTTLRTTPAEANINVTYERYIPSASTAQHNIQPAVVSNDGLYTEIKPESTALNVNPEVAMLFSSSYSDSSALAFAAGDRLREVRPVTFNTIRYKRGTSQNPIIDPVANGLSVATDKGATDLASRLNASGKDVIYKGSATTNSVSADGIVEFKTYALDIGQSSLKNAWNPGTTYSTQAINEEFLSRFLTRNATTGAWDALFNTNGKYLINNAEVGGVNGTKTVSQTGTTTAIPHTLEIRGGRLVRVNGAQVNTLSSELQTALTSMGIRTDDKGVFVQFESGRGAAISNESSTNLNFVNAARHTSDWANGRNWYNEDTTVMVVWEYTTTFEIPSFEYSDKLPMSILGIESPSDKTKFFESGYAAHMLIRYSIAGRGASASSEAFMTANTQTGHNTNNSEPRFSVPNVSVQDTFSTVR